MSPLALDVDEVQRHAHQVDREVRQLVHSPLDVAPVVLVDPVLDELAVVVTVVAVAPVVVAEVLREPGAPQALVEVLEVLLGDGDGER